jgi:transposase
MGWFAGVDWGTETHAVCVVDERGQIVGRWRVAHSAVGLQELCTRLAAVTAPAALAVAVEQAAGVLVDRLRAAGHSVVVVPPAAVRGLRTRYRSTRRKSDPEDAYILADVLRTDGHRFPPTAATSERTRMLRTLTRARRDLVRERLRLANQLRAVLATFWPGVDTLFTDLTSSIALEFLRCYATRPTPTRVTPGKLAAFLRRQGYSGTRTGAQLCARLREAVPPTGTPSERAVQARVVASYVTLLTSVQGELKTLELAIATALAQHPDRAVIESFPGTRQITTGQLLAEMGDDRTRFPTRERLEAEAGVVPVTSTSGKHRAVSFRWACNKRLREAVSWLAANSRARSPWAAAMYQRARARGCRHAHALRIVGRAWIRILWRCWQSNTPYDPAQHRAAVAIAAAG